MISQTIQLGVHIVTLGWPWAIPRPADGNVSE
jgi:hypothetical protein